MGVKGGVKRDDVTRFEPVLAKQSCRHFQAGDVTDRSIDTGEVRQSKRRFIDNRLQSGSDAAVNGVGRSAGRDNPFGAVTWADDLVLVSNVLGHVLRIQPKIECLLI